MAKTQARLDDLTKPRGSLGVMESIAKKIAGITGKVIPSISKKTCILMAGDHGVTEEGVSAYPREVTAQMVLNFLEGGAAMSVLTRHVGAELVVVDVGVNADFADNHFYGIKSGRDNEYVQGQAMTPEQTFKALEVGFETVSNCLDEEVS